MIASKCAYNPEEPMLDITGAEDVQIDVRSDDSVIWVNVDGVCRLRVCRIRKHVRVTHGSKELLDAKRE